ncbi:MAG: hypothetical protein NZM06_06925 [Chloroherpetonaceae bacterium]|nr:hypothetical protein [Chloroherpetonaceae bacterium]MDW8437771.1 hypothetical protein [Chloroherpetonaceae bacterium]
MKAKASVKKSQTTKSKSASAKPSSNGVSAESRPNERVAPAFNAEKRQAIIAGKIKDMHCDVCGVTGGWEYVGDWRPNDVPRDSEVDPPEDDNEPKYWLRCKNCSSVLVVEEWKIQINREKSLDELTIEDCITYTPQGIYRVGDAIYHKALDKIGIVRSKQLTNSGASAITIEFKDLGMRQLLENVTIDENGAVSDPGKKGKLKLKKIIKR